MRSIWSNLQEWLSTYMLYAMVIGVVVLLWSSGHLTRNMSDNILVGLGLGTIFLVIARQVITLRENERLNRALRAFSQELEARVQERTLKLATLQSITFALSAATSTKEVCEIGLRAVLGVAQGESAVFYGRDGSYGDFRILASMPADRPPANVTSPYQVAEMVRRGDCCVVVMAGTETSPARVYVPVSERGQTYGLIEISVPELPDPIDEQTLSTIGAAFGLAYEDQRRYEEARHLADHDPVTGLFNHRHFHIRLESLLTAAREARSTLGLVIMDIDDFKLFNDTYGHPKGDEVLELIGRHLRESCPAQLVSARFGGDEFAVALPGANVAETVEFIRRFREWIDQQGFQVDGGLRIPIRLTFGYAVFPEDGSKRYEIVAAADARLYEAKRAGISVLATREDEQGYKASYRYGTFTLLDGLIESIDNKDHYTKAHCDHVSEYAVMIAETMGLSEVVHRSLALAGALHDVGKICIPDRILRKPGPLTPEEYEIVKMHVTLAPNLLHNIPRRKDVLDAVVHHHERFDGTGYAKGLKGKEIPLLGRIMAVADAFSAMTLDRVYRKALPIEQAIEEMKRGAGTQFDPEVLEAFLVGLSKRVGKLPSPFDSASSPVQTLAAVESDSVDIPVHFRRYS